MSLPKPVYHGLKSEHLRQLAGVLGVPLNGTRKADLLAGIDASLQQNGLIAASTKPVALRKNVTTTGASTPKPDVNRRFRILSVDMGIRNLAYCVLDVDRAWAQADQKRRQIPVEERPLVRVLDWQRLSLYSGPDEGEAVESLATSPDGNQPSSSSSRSSTTPEAFSPPWMAAAAWQVLSSLVVPPQALLMPVGNDVGAAAATDISQSPPDLVLVERQRWRSAGSAAVTEWTLRVNTLEAMLWSGLEVLQRAGVWRGPGGVRAVDPKRVASLWVASGAPTASYAALGNSGDSAETTAEESGDSTSSQDAPKQRKRKASSQDIKKAKIAVVRAWAQSAEPASESKSSMATQEAPEAGVVGKLTRPETAGMPNVEWVGQAERVRRAFISTKGAGAGASSRKKKKKENEETESEVTATAASADRIAKKDDLADCLLQGMAWIRWEENRRAVLGGELFGIGER